MDEKMDGIVTNRQAADEDRIQWIGMSRQDARDLFDAIQNSSEGDWNEPLTDAIDKAQGDTTDGRVRYIVIEINPE